MSALRGIFVGALIGAATLVGSGAATAEPLPLEPFTPAATESVAGGLCDAHPAIGLWCLISQSA
ncbi:hypothetical protein AB0H49_23220 [Nocardia sp. NPDC050713]|uniref:hypothetical protein n=1 Tax=unclassified Nocardia TaxID=2637762 RepID=UPI0033AD9042